MFADRALTRFILLLATSLLAGVCGAAAAFLFLIPAAPPELPERIPLPIRRTGIEIPRVPVVTVGLTGAKSLRAVPGGSAVAGTDVLASATVLTSDGWLVTDASVFATLVDPRALLPDGTALAPTEVIRDEGTGLAYLHVDARGLDVVVFGDSATLPAGTALFRASANRTLVPVGLETAHARLRGEPRDVVRDSYEVAERLVLSPSAPRPAAGAGLITTQGALVGIAVATGKGPVESAVPIEAVARALRDIVRSGAIERPSLGIATVDLSELAVRDEDLVGAFGALVSGVEKAGPAAGAIQTGDRITAVGGEPLDGSRLLSEILSSYRIGERITLTFVREGEERSASLTVGAMTVPKH